MWPSCGGPNFSEIFHIDFAKEYEHVAKRWLSNNKNTTVVMVQHGGSC
jgi:broad specificity phosphatase PhoE